ncbi:MAG: TIGR01906 family membrane protein [Clostridiales bacterium]|jgi:integral membrane protein (TIGR01906 family)|nr:TIGR01906 family membrane protein [Clostridiales bacterium]
MKWLLGYLAGLCVLTLIVCEAIALPTFSKAFYSHEFDKYGVPETISVEKNELMRVTSEMLDYMRGRRGDLNVPSVVAGQEREFFNQREKDHMVDVYKLFEIGFRVRNIAFWSLLFLILLMVFLKIRVSFILARCCREIVAGFLILSAILAGIIAIDFDRAFTVFHLIFFSNDLWQLNPATDLLVNIVPIGFFTDIAIFIGALFLVFSAVIIIIATVCIRKMSAVERYPDAAVSRRRRLK